MKTFQSAIIQRFFTKGEYNAFVENYDSHKKARQYEGKRASQTDREIYSYFKDGHSIKKTAKKYGVSQYKVLGAISRIAAEL